MAALDNIPEPQPRKRFWGKIAAALAAVMAAVGITVGAFGFNATNHFQQDQIRALQAVSDCRTQLAVDVDVTKGDFLLAEGEFIVTQGRVNQILVDALLHLGDQSYVEKAVVDAAAANSDAVEKTKALDVTRAPYEDALDARAATNDVCESP